MSFRPLLLLLALLLAVGPWSPVLAKEPRMLLLAAPPVQQIKLEHLQPLAARHGIRLDYRLLSDKVAPPAPQELAGYDFMMLDAAYGPSVMMLQQQFLPGLKADALPWLWLRRDGNQSRLLEPALVKTLDTYYSNGGSHNYDGFFCHLAAHLQKTAARCVEPRLYPDNAIYHPSANGDVFTNLESYLAFRKTRLQPDTALVGILFHKAYLDSGMTGFLDATIARLEQKGAVAVPMYVTAMGNGEITRLAGLQGKPRLDVLINLQIMLNAEGRRAELAALGIPVLQVMAYRHGDQAAWEKDNVGLTTMDIPFYLSQPEYAGLTDPMFAAASEPNGNQIPIDRQLESVANKAVALTRLRHLPSARIKTAILFYNYPPGEKNLGASFMNVPQSLEQLLKDYQARGYQVETRTEQQLIDELTALLRPFYRDDSLASLLEQGKAGRLPLDTYLGWFKTLPQPLQDAINQRWGQPQQANLFLPENEGLFAIPRLQLGNQMILPQPPRSEREADQEKALYHDTKVPPSHSYLAAYLWLRETAKVDALVHFGTHGSQEWQPGKERGLDVQDYPLMVLGDVPVLYPYIVDNIGEALQTKRRGRATVISHNTPSFGPAGLHGDLIQLHDLLHQWLNLTDGEVRNQITQNIHAKATALKLDKDLALDLQNTPDFAAVVDQLHIHIHDLALAQQPLGLAHFGLAAEPDLRLFTVQQMLGRPLLEQLMPEDPEELLVVDYEKLKQTPVWKLLDTHIRQNQPWTGDKATGELIEKGRQYWAALGNNQETEGYFTVLQGRYLPTSYGGDPIKNPDSLPTGRNLYGFDPSRIPTPAAWEAGKIAAERLLEQHKADKGEYPQKLAFTLWSVETMRHLGLLEAQAFALMGFKPVWDRGGQVTGIKKIPAAELKRPRVDVVISATGLYRDHFPQVMKWLAQAADQASDIDEPGNAIAANTRQIEQQLLASGLGKADARLAARTRIFSSESGAYSTGLEDATLASDSFGETADGKQDRAAGEAKLAKLYLERMQFAYGPDESRWGEKSSVNVYAEQLKGVQGAVLSRSSNLYGMLTTDDPFQYLGGIGLAVRQLTGQSPSLYISNLRDSNNPKAETAAGFLARDLRTRYLHPGWIKQIQKEGYSGALQVLGSVNNLWGWQVVAPETVRDDQWQEYKAVYLDDKYNLDINEWFEKNHPQAQAQLIERMLEAARKEYWNTDAKTLQDLAQRYQDLAQRHDVVSNNERFNEFVAQAAAGFGLQAPAAQAATGQPAAEQPAAEQSATAAPARQVQGQKLEKQEQQPAEPQPFDILSLLGVALMLLAFIGGLLKQMAATRSNLQDPHCNLEKSA